MARVLKLIFLIATPILFIIFVYIVTNPKNINTDNTAVVEDLIEALNVDIILSNMESKITIKGDSLVGTSFDAEANLSISGDVAVQYTNRYNNTSLNISASHLNIHNRNIYIYNNPEITLFLEDGKRHSINAENIDFLPGNNTVSLYNSSSIKTVLSGDGELYISLENGVLNYSLISQTVSGRGKININLNDIYQIRSLGDAKVVYELKNSIVYIYGRNIIEQKGSNLVSNSTIINPETGKITFEGDVLISYEQ